MTFYFSRTTVSIGFATLDKAATLALATSKALTGLRQYINSDLGFSDLKMCVAILKQPQITCNGSHWQLTLPQDSMTIEKGDRIKVK